MTYLQLTYRSKANWSANDVERKADLALATSGSRRPWRAQGERTEKEQKVGGGVTM